MTLEEEKKQIRLDEEFERIWKKIESGENIALLRYGDGERAIMTGKSVTAQEGWKSPEGICELGKALNGTLDVESENFIYGISCPCCDRAAYYWYSTRIKSKNRTFANIFVNKNYATFSKKFEELKRDAIFIGNKRGENARIGNLNIIKYYSVSDNCIEFWEKGAKELIEQIKREYGNKNNILYVISAGPLAEPIIKELWENNPNNCYIDFGSSIDKYIHKTKTRPYEDPKNKYAKRNCEMDNPNATNFDVRVVLTLYKRSENLKLQIDAIKSQTLKPKEILLYQDVPVSGEKAVIPEEIKNEFNIIETAEKNAGVWGRFRFSKDFIKENDCYVCIFDDDTIPGSSWLENCHSQMLKNEGIYGTIGILMKKPEKYPFSGYIRIGWAAPTRKTNEVDFVGHSWFFPKRILNYMFEDTEKYQNYKYCGEDMGISFAAKKQLNMRTFVPPHPTRHKEMWGSLPEYASKLGNNDKTVSISLNKDNLKNMNDVMNDYLNDGIKTLNQTNKKYVIKMWNRHKTIKLLTKFIPCKKARHTIRGKLTELLYK